MRVRALFALFIFLLAARAGDAGTYTIDFSSLAADAGQTITTQIDVGPFCVYINDCLVIGPGDPGYTGQIGLLPETNQYAVIIDDGPTPGSPEPYDIDSVSAAFAAGSSSQVDWMGSIGEPYPGPLWGMLWTWDDSVAGSQSFTPDPSPWSGERIWLEPNDSNGAQLLSVTIDAEFLSAASALPEPSSFLTFILGIGGISLACAVRGVSHGAGPRGRAAFQKP